MKTKIAIAVSGGIDSLVSGHLLKEQGHDLTGIHFFTGYEKPGMTIDQIREQAEHDMSLMSDQLNIPIHVIDISAEFKREVVDYFTGTYLKGKTPNPCLKCNQVIKFGLLLKYADKYGCQSIATGHYARIERDENQVCRLIKGVDTFKDQSYFLGFLNSHQLSRAIFPLGGLVKDETRRIAKENGLTPVSSSESQDICFVPNAGYSDFLLSETGITPEEGPIIGRDGKTIGTHKGLHKFTIGQRKGINCPAAEPYYVVKTDIPNNTLHVGFKQDLLAESLSVSDLNWIGTPPEEGAEVYTRIRYRHKEVASRIYLKENGRAVIRFKEPQASVTPGQGAVFYVNNQVLGAGWIE